MRIESPRGDGNVAVGAKPLCHALVMRIESPRGDGNLSLNDLVDHLPRVMRIESPRGDGNKIIRHPERISTLCNEN